MSVLLECALRFMAVCGDKQDPKKGVFCPCLCGVISFLHLKWPQRSVLLLVQAIILVIQSEMVSQEVCLTSFFVTVFDFVHAVRPPLQWGEKGSVHLLGETPTHVSGIHLPPHFGIKNGLFYPMQLKKKNTKQLQLYNICAVKCAIIS